MFARNLMVGAILAALASTLSCSSGPTTISASSTRLISAQVVPSSGGFSVAQQLLAFNAPACKKHAECSVITNPNLANYPAPSCTEYTGRCSSTLASAPPGYCILRLRSGAECLSGTAWNCTTDGYLGIYSCTNSCTWSTAGCVQCGGDGMACCPVASGPTCTGFGTTCHTDPATIPSGVTLFPTGTCLL